MHLIALGWLYVVLMMAIAEAVSSQGSLLGAVITFLMYGLLPLALVLYIGGTPQRRRRRRAAEAAEFAALAAGQAESSGTPDGGGVPPGAPAAAKREEP